MAERSHYWFYKCPVDGIERVASVPLSEKDVELHKASNIPNQHFRCETCGKEHEGYLAQSKQ